MGKKLSYVCQRKFQAETGFDWIWLSGYDFYQYQLFTVKDFILNYKSDGHYRHYLIFSKGCVTEIIKEERGKVHIVCMIMYTQFYLIDTEYYLKEL